MNDMAKNPKSPAPDFDFDFADIDSTIKDEMDAARKREEARIKEDEELRRKRDDDRKRIEGKRGLSNPDPQSSKPKKQFEVITFNDIIGMDTAKAEILEAVVYPSKFADVYARYQKRSVKGVMLYGPPGNGKTLLGKATAHAIASLSGKEYSEEAFTFFTATDFLNMYVGQSEANIRRAFDQARAFEEQNGYRKVIFIDEPDGVFPKRGSNPGNPMSDSVVTTLLGELDGFKKLSAFVMLATNRPDIIDPAITREGRIDRKVYCDRPSQSDCEKTFAYYLKKTCANNIDKLSKFATKELFSLNYRFFTLDLEDGSKVDFNLKDIRSFSMIAALVDSACGQSIMRDIKLIESGNTEVEGFITESEMKLAIEKTFNQSRHINHDDSVRDLVNGKRIVRLTR